SCTTRIVERSPAKACARPPPNAPDLTSSTPHDPMKPSTGAAVRLHRNAVRHRPESLSAFKWNACPPSPEYALEVEELVDPSKQVVGRHVIVEAEIVEQPRRH